MKRKIALFLTIIMGLLAFMAVPVAAEGYPILTEGEECLGVAHIHAEDNISSSEGDAIQPRGPVHCGSAGNWGTIYISSYGGWSGWQTQSKLPCTHSRVGYFHYTEYRTRTVYQRCTGCTWAGSYIERVTQGPICRQG